MAVTEQPSNKSERSIRSVAIMHLPEVCGPSRSLESELEWLVGTGCAGSLPAWRWTPPDRFRCLCRRQNFVLLAARPSPTGANGVIPGSPRVSPRGAHPGEPRSAASNQIWCFSRARFCLQRCSPRRSTVSARSSMPVRSSTSHESPASGARSPERLCCILRPDRRRQSSPAPTELHGSTRRGAPRM